MTIEPSYNPMKMIDVYRCYGRWIHRGSDLFFLGWVKDSTAFQATIPALSFAVDAKKWGNPASIPMLEE